MNESESPDRPEVEVPPAAALNVGVPHPSRIYDYYLGGKDHFAVDREAGDRAISLFPDTPRIALQNRGFLGRAVRYLVRDAGIGQFLDIGSGLPSQGNVHEIAQRADPAAKVVYVDNDPLVLVHARALLDGGNTRVITADLRDPDRILREASQTLDFTRPIALMLAAVLHFIEGDVTALVHTYLDRLAPGSALVLSHVTGDDADPDRLNEGVHAYSTTPSGVHIRSSRQVTDLFNGTTPVDPGIVPLWEWRPRPGDDEAPTTPRVLGGIGLL